MQEPNELVMSVLVVSGAYVPLTMEGNIMVDEVLASCYASVDHTLAHFAMTPLQLFPQMVEWIIGGDNEIQDYVGMAKSVGRYLLPDTYLHGRMNFDRK